MSLGGTKDQYCIASSCYESIETLVTNICINKCMHSKQIPLTVRFTRDTTKLL